MDQHFAPLPDRQARRFGLSAVVRLGDAGPHGRARLDALTRYLQDIAREDGEESGIGGVWVLRRMALRFTGSWPRLDDPLSLTTFCSGTGGRWAERRTIMEAPRGRVDAAAIWVLIDQSSGRPLRIPGTFAELYGDQATRPVSSRLTVPGPPPKLAGRPWKLRSTDFDVLNHVNNARYWEAVEDELTASGRPRLGSAVTEFRTAIEAGHEPEVLSDDVAGGMRVWLRTGGVIHSASEVTFVD
ncbi:MAG: acyl-[acyl-carrier-protein] thioesterase [Acidimicrobiales bacterium]